MLTIFWLVFWAGLAALVVAAGVTLHVRRKEAIASAAPVVDDEVLDQILTKGEVWVEEDEPLDLEEIDDEEERFWSESWDEPSEDW
jgi:hypothetical protein